MSQTEEIVYLQTEDIHPYLKNPRHNEKAVPYVANSIREFGFKVPIVVDESHTVICGHTRLAAAKSLGLEEVPCIIATDLTQEQVQAFRLADNKTAEIAEWDEELLQDELDDLTDIFDMSDFGFLDELEELVQEPEAYEDDYDPELTGTPNAVLGDIYQLGEHRLMCGSSTDATDVEQLMNGELADLCFTDPPYGMKKERDGVLNDNLNFDDLLEFNKQWIPLSFECLKDTGSWYCWGIDEPLMDIYSNILKPMIKRNEITFRNLLTWDKGSGQGQLSKEFRMYPVADEKCLFVMCGVQGFNTNADHYFEQWEPIRKYLEEQRKLCGWDIPQMKKIAGHSDLSRDHWTSKSQWSLVPEYVYKKFQKWAESNGVDAFKREYDEIKREYDEIKREYYSTRAYFNNTHDNMNNVWHFARTSAEEREETGGHATPKPIALCSRAIVSSSREGELVVDFFGGSGSTLIAAEQLKRRAYLMELDPHFVDVIIDRWQKMTGKKAKLLNEETNPNRNNKK